LEHNATTEDCLTWLIGTAKANELFLDLEDEVILLKGRDFGRHTTLLQGKLEEDFITTAKSMGWDILPIAGSYVIEYPKGHESIIKTLQTVNRSPVSFLMNISVLDQSDTKSSGIRVSDFIDFSVYNFDILHYKQPITSVNLPSVSLQSEQIKFMQNNTYTLVLTSIMGEPVTQRVDTQKSIVTTSRDAFGQTVNQQVTTFTSGFIANLVTYPHHEGCLTQLDLEISQDVSMNDDELPVIARKSIKNAGVLVQGQTWLAGKFEGTTYTRDNRKTFFAPWKRNDTAKQIMIVVVKRVL
tara:strand:+ start:2500 stop:3390 length:891 start_codon:yes stop_codon:yes gene_type:complete